MLSGIGPAELLNKTGIPVILDNPNVGKNLRNPTLNFATFTVNPNDNPLPPDDPNAIYTGGAFLPDPTPQADQNSRGLELLGMGSNDSLTLVLLYLKPKSRGSIKAQSNDSLQIALADEGFLANPADWKR
jgi:choline dehydrogenase